MPHCRGNAATRFDPTRPGPEQPHCARRRWEEERMVGLRGRRAVAAPWPRSVCVCLREAGRRARREMHAQKRPPRVHRRACTAASSRAAADAAKKEGARTKSGVEEGRGSTPRAPGRPVGGRVHQGRQRHVAVARAARSNGEKRLTAAWGRGRRGSACRSPHGAPVYGDDAHARGGAPGGVPQARGLGPAAHVCRD